MKKILCIALAISLCVFTSFGVLASNYAADQQYYEFLGDIISETTHLSQALDELGLPLQELLDLPELNPSLLSDVQQYTARNQSRSTLQPTPKTLLGERITYVTKMADQSVRRNPNLHLNPHMEIVYMYLSHYVDVRVPSDITSPVNSNSLGGTLGMYILPNDRQNYDLYLRKGSAFRAGNALVDFSQASLSFKGNVKEQQEIIRTVNGLKIDVKTFLDTYDSANNSITLVESAGKIFNSFKKNVVDATSAEDLINKIDRDLVFDLIDPKLIENIPKIILDIGVAVSGGVAGVAMASVMFTVNQFQFYSTQFLDHVNWIALSTTRNMRIANRTWEYMKYTR